MVKLKRYAGNPILLPVKSHDWESLHVSNAGAAVYNGKTYLLYRAEGKDERKSSSGWPVSRLGLASSDNGYDFNFRSSRPAFDVTQEKWPGVDGVEDARISKIGNVYYIVYVLTSFTWDRIALATTKDFKTFTRHGVMMGDVAQRTSGLFPAKFNRRYLLMHRIIPSIYLSETYDFKNFKNTKIIMNTDVAKWCEKKLGIGAQPVKLKNAWALFFHGVDRSSVYRLGIAWLDLKNPYKIIKIQKEPILEPLEPYEKSGFTPNVVYTCGAVEKDDKILVYYGCCDSVLALATVAKKDIEL